MNAGPRSVMLHVCACVRLGRRVASIPSMQKHRRIAIPISRAPRAEGSFVPVCTGLVTIRYGGWACEAIFTPVTRV